MGYADKQVCTTIRGPDEYLIIERKKSRGTFNPGQLLIFISQKIEIEILNKSIK